MQRWVKLVAGLLAFGSWLLASSNAPPSRSTGGFGESTCATCHSGAAVNSGSGTFRIEGVPAQYTPGATIPITVTIAQTGQRRWGFELAARSRVSGAQAGSFSAAAGLVVLATNGIWYVGQSSSGVRDGVVNGPVSWTFNWTAPASTAGEVWFTAAGLAADGDGSERGDFTYTAQAATTPAGPLSSPLPAKPVLAILPHHVRGGGYVTRIFLSNLTSSANSVQMNTVGQDGRIVESVTMTLPAGGSYLSATSENDRFSPDMQIRWVAIGADAPVAASVLFDLHNPTTRALQTAVAVLDSPPQTLSTVPVLYRSDGVTLGLAVANLAGADNNITLKLLDTQGNIVVNDTLVLPPYAQNGFVLSNRQPFSEFLGGQTEFVGALIVSGSQRFAAVAIGAEGSELFSIPLASGAAR